MCTAQLFTLSCQAWCTQAVTATENLALLMTLCTVCAESRRGRWTVPGAATVLQYALDVQLHINSSWEEDTSQPRWQPWKSLTTLFTAEKDIPEAQRALLLQFVLASPPSFEVRSLHMYSAPTNCSGITLAEGNPQRHARVYTK